MDEKQNKSSKKHTGVIITWIIVAIIVIIGGAFLYLHLSKPSAKDALDTAAKTKINSTRATLVIKQNKTKSETLTYELKDNTIHLSNNFVPKNKNQEQDNWITKDKFYFLTNNKWNYMKRNSLTNTFVKNSEDTYKQIFTGHDFNKLSNEAMKKFNVQLDGLKGYTLTYQGSNQAVIKGMLKVASGTNESDSSQIKNIDVTIKTNRQKELTGYNIYYTFKNNESSTRMKLDEINSVNSLSVPKKVKTAKEIVTPNLR